MSAVLQGKVAIVTGASRGVGKGIALSLGEAGTTVYIVARSGRGLWVSDLASAYHFTDIDGKIYVPTWKPH